MPDDRVKYSDAIQSAEATTLENDDVLALAREDSQSPTGYSSKATRMLTVAKKVALDTDFSQDLETTSPYIIGAINELAQGGGGGSADIISTASGTIATFNDGGDDIPVKSLITEITATQAGTGTPSPSNPRPITGFDSVDVVVSGINLWDEEWENCSWNTSGVKTPTVNTIGSKNYIEVKPNTTYYFVFPSTWTRLVVRELDVNKAFVTNSLPSPSNRSITTSSNTRFIVFSTWSDDNITTYSNNISINYPSTETAYHAYTGTTHTIPLPETIYGGTADLANGTGIKTHENIASYNGETINEPWLCSEAPFVSGTTPPTGSQVVYPLATPTTISFTPEQIPTLSGENNIYSNTGDVEVEYFNENADQIAELIRVMTR